MSRFVWLFCLMSIMVLVAGCVTDQPVVKPTPTPAPVVQKPTVDTAEEAEARLAAAGKAFAEKRYQDAEKYYSDYLRRFPDQPGQTEALFRRGQIGLELDSTAAARRDFEDLIGHHPESPHVLDAKLALGRIMLMEQQPTAALSQLVGLSTQPLSEEQTIQYYLVLAKARFMLGQPKTALEALFKGHAQVPVEIQNPFVEQLREFIRDWPEKTVDNLSRLYATEFPSVYLAYGLVVKALNEGNWTKTLNYLKELESRFPGHPLAVMARQIQEKAWQTEKPKYTIGCLLPLSGPYERYGRQILEGMQLAAGIFKAASNFRMVIEDTANDADVTTAALERLAAQEEALAVVGPISGNMAAAAGKKAQELAVPLITLTQRRSVAQLGRYVLRDFITPSLMIESLARRAVTDLGLKRIAMLYPATSYGNRMVQVMAQAVQANGGMIVNQVSYPAELADLAKQLLALGGQNPDDPPREGDKPFDALFIPDGYVQASQIAPQLAFYDLTPTVLLGTNLWHQQEMIKMVGPYVQGALVPSSFYGRSEEANVKNFVEQFRVTFGREPGLFAAAGFDAVKLIVDLADTGQVENREQLLDLILKTTSYQGVTGLTGFNEQGEAIKVPYLLTIKGKQFVPAPITYAPEVEPFVVEEPPVNEEQTVVEPKPEEKPEEETTFK